MNVQVRIEHAQRVASGRGDSSARAFEIPVTLDVPSGFFEPARHVRGTVRLEVTGFRDGGVRAEATFVREQAE